MSTRFPRPSRSFVIALVAFLAVGAAAFYGGNLFAAYRQSKVPAPHVHFHANFAVYVDGSKVDFSGKQYMEPVELCTISTNQPPEGRVHLHDNDGGLIHVHAAQVTWGDLLANLGWAVSDRGIVTRDGQAYVSDTGHTVTFVLNGQAVDGNVMSTYIKPNDRLLVNYGDESKEALLKRFSAVPTNAPAASATSDPATCSGS